MKLSGDQDVPFLTRAGDFHVDASRNLVTSDGLHVLNSNSEAIQLDEGATSFSISSDGTILQTLGDGTINSDLLIGVAKVSNPGGLEKIGGNLYRMTLNASAEGALEPTTANNAEVGTGTIVAGQLEMSNVDLTGEFTEMIVTQRGFQANSRIITTSDEVLQEVVNLKR